LNKLLAYPIDNFNTLLSSKLKSYSCKTPFVSTYKTSTEAKLEEARIREENLLRSNEDFKKEIKQQAEETNKLLKQMMEMFQNQGKP